VIINTNASKKKHITNEIINFYEHPDIKKNLKPLDNPNFYLHQIKLNFRMGLIAGSGMGKSNAVTNIISLFAQNKGTFSHIYVYHKIEEALYDWLKEKCGDKITFYKKISDVPSCRDLKPSDPTNESPALFIFDDCCNEKNQEKISDYFIFGRKAYGGVGISCMYLSQKYFAIPTIIREQLNYIILLKIRGDRNLKLILKDCNIGLDMDDFNEIYRDATQTEFSFLKIGIANRDDDKVLSKGFDKFYQISDLL
jgi:hypothetical protein